MVHRPRAAVTAALAGSLVLGTAGAAGAPARPVTAKPALTLSLGQYWAGRTGQDFPVYLEVDGPAVRRITDAFAVLRLPCSTGGFYTSRDAYPPPLLKVDRKGRFHASFGPQTQRFDDGTSLDREGFIRGRVQRFRTRASGTWRLKWTFRDAAGAVTDECDSGPVTWKVRD